MNKKQLALILSKLATFKKLKVELEQYQSEPEIAADVLWFAFMSNDVKDKVIADLGCGAGVYGLGALSLGAKKAYFVDLDAEALKIAKENKKFAEKLLKQKFKAQFLNINVNDFKAKVDTVIQNPPFGVKKTHVDKLFLLKAMEVAPVIYSFHKISTKDFINKLVKENGFEVKKILKYKFPLKKKLWFHRKKVYFVDVGCWKITKNDKMTPKKILDLNSALFSLKIVNFCLF